MLLLSASTAAVDAGTVQWKHNYFQTEAETKQHVA